MSDKNISTSLPVTFLKDEPSDTDEFGSHQRVADAVNAVLSHSPSTRVIGLLGGWGSGKSTVIKLIEDGFEDEKTGPKTLFFTYDAWLHQSDNPRRSFLEELIALILEHDKDGEKFYRKELKSLSGQVIQKTTKSTPVLTPTGKWAAFFFALVPVGLAFVGFDTLKEAFGSTNPPQADSGLARTALLFGSLLLAAPLPFFFFLWLRETFYSDKNEGDNTHTKSDLDSAIFSLFMNKHVEIVDDETTISPEPTSIEFQRSLHKIMTSITANEIRLVCIIDNLDRLAPDEALQMWSTMRSIFLGPNKKNGPVVILPVDDDAIGKVFSPSEESETRNNMSKSFSDKTFDITFEVPRPVISDWRKFLEKQMLEAFGELATPRLIYWTQRFFEAHVQKSKRRVTPREINNLVNTLAGLYLQWKDENISLETMSYYVINKTLIKANLFKFLTTTIPPLAQFAPNWQREIAAIFYGVQEKKAAQILLKEPLTSAIWSLDKEAILKLKDISGFNDTFEEIISDFPLGDDETPSFQYIGNSAILLDDYSEQNEPWIRLSWAKLIAAYIGKARFDKIDKQLSLQVAAFYPHLSAGTKQQFVDATTDALTGVLLADDFPTKSVDVDQTALQLIKFCDVEKVKTPVFDIGINIGRLIALLSRYANSPEFWKRLRINSKWPDIEAELVEMLSKPLQAHLVADVIGMLNSEMAKDIYDQSEPKGWMTLVEATNQIARGQGDPAASLTTAFEVLGKLLPIHKDTKPVVDALASEGHLGTQLNALGKTEEMSLAPLLTIMVLQGGDHAEPSNGSWQTLASNGPLVKSVVGNLSEYTGNYYMHYVWASHHNAPSMRPFCTALVRTMISESRLGRVSLKTVLGNMSYYRQPVPFALRQQFVTLLRGYKTFWQKISASSLDNNLLTTVEMTIKAGGDDASKMCRVLMARLEKRSKSEWAQIVRGKSDATKLMVSIANSGFVTINKGSKPYRALLAATAELTSQDSQNFAVRWCNLATISTVPAQKVLFDALTKAMFLHGNSPQNLNFLQAGGANLLKYGVFNEEPDQSILNIVIPQMSNAKGRTWLRKHSKEVRTWLAKCNTETVNNIKSVLDKFENGNAKNRKDFAEVIRKQWKI